MVSSTASASHLFPGFLFHEAFAETGSQKSPARDVLMRPSPMPGRNRMMADALCPEVFWRYLKIFRSECGRVPTIKLGRIVGFRMFASTETAKLEHRRNGHGTQSARSPQCSHSGRRWSKGAFPSQQR